MLGRAGESLFGLGDGLIEAFDRALFCRCAGWERGFLLL